MVRAARARHAVIRTDASRQMGGGHLSRCLTLAEALRAVGVSVEFVMAPGEFSGWVAARGFTLSVLGGPPGGEQDLRETRDIADARRALLAVVDGYHFAPSFSKALHDGGLFTCCIDDLADHFFTSDVVLNANLQACTLAYEVAPHCKLLLGPSYALVRDEFIAAREQARPPRQEARLVLVTMGAADPDGWTQRVLRALERVAAGLEVRVALGAANLHGAAVQASARALAPRHVVDVLEPSNDMAQQMLWCDVAITAGGTTCMELACVGVPAVTLSIAPNQRAGVAELDRMGLMRAVGGERSEHEIAAIVSEVLCDAPARSAMVSRQRAAVDGQGKHRAVERILEWADRPEGAS